MRETLQVILGWIAFGGSHLLLSHGDIRDSLLRRLGPTGFKAFYSVVALGTFWLLVTAYFTQRHAGSLLWDLRQITPAVRLVEILMFLSFFSMVGALFMPSPLSMDPRGKYEPRGLLRITRHPFGMGAALFGISHCILIGYPSDLAFFGGFTVFAIAAAFHQDARKRREAPSEKQAFFEQTSVIPFAAILGGRQSFKVGELPWIAGLAGIAVALIIRLYHAKWFGVPVS